MLCVSVLLVLLVVLLLILYVLPWLWGCVSAGARVLSASSWSSLSVNLASIIGFTTVFSNTMSLISITCEVAWPLSFLATSL
uniref:Uncharacterized protein n=1 Tax=Anopheles darlingi TaxID=43151 RepID=A0A2M4D1T0_ANODA